MGITRQPGTDIFNFWPDNDDNTLYIPVGFGCSSLDLQELMETIESHFGDSDLSSYVISSEYIHTSCIYYDLHDPSDYTNFVIIERKRKC